MGNVININAKRNMVEEPIQSGFSFIGEVDKDFDKLGKALNMGRNGD